MGMFYGGYLPTFGMGVPGGNVCRLMPYYDISAAPYVRYIYRGAWRVVG